MFWPVLIRAYVQYILFFCVLGAFVVHYYAADSVKPVPVESSWVLLATYVAYRGCIALKYVQCVYVAVTNPKLTLHATGTTAGIRI